MGELALPPKRRAADGTCPAQLPAEVSGGSIATSVAELIDSLQKDTTLGAHAGKMKQRDEVILTATMQVRDPTTWTKFITRHDGPHHLGL